MMGRSGKVGPRFAGNFHPMRVPGLPMQRQVLELPHVDGMQFASEALPACMAASLSGALFGDAPHQAPRRMQVDQPAVR